MLRGVTLASLRFFQGVLPPQLHPGWMGRHKNPRMQRGNIQALDAKRHQSKILSAAWKGRLTTSMATANGSSTSFSKGFIPDLDL